MLSALFSCNGRRSAAAADKYESISSVVHSPPPPSLPPCKYQNPPEQIAAASSPSRMLMYCFGKSLKSVSRAYNIHFSRHFIEDIPPVCSDGDDDLAQGLVWSIQPARGSKYREAAPSSLPLSPFHPPSPPRALIFTFLTLVMELVHPLRSDELSIYRF